MGYCTISNWETTEWNDDLVALAQNTFAPLIMATGAARVQMIRTGDMSFSVITEYSDESAAEAAQEKIAEIRAKAANELPMTMSSRSAGPVFAGS